MAHRRERRIKLLALAMSGLITLFLLYDDLMNPSFVKNSLDLLEMKCLDFRFRLREAHHPSESGTDLSVIAIDEKSIEEIGRWPWPRTEMGRLVEKLAEGNPRVIAFDILFTEPEVSESLKLVRALKSDYAAMASPDPRFLKTLKIRERESDSDVRFAEIIERAGIVVLPIALVVPTEYQSGQGQKISETSETSEFLTPSSFGLVKHLGTAKIFFPIGSQAVLSPIPPLAQAAKTLGHVYYQPDRDGDLRWEYLVVKYGDDYYPSFSLQIARTALGIRREAMKLWMGEAVEMGTINIPTDERGRMLIHYVGREGTLSFIRNGGEN